MSKTSSIPSVVSKTLRLLTDAQTQRCSIDVKKRFFTFFGHVFYVFNVFFIFQTFLLFKTANLKFSGFINNRILYAAVIRM